MLMVLFLERKRTKKNFGIAPDAVENGRFRPVTKAETE